MRQRSLASKQEHPRLSELLETKHLCNIYAYKGSSPVEKEPDMQVVSYQQELMENDVQKLQLTTTEHARISYRRLKYTLQHWTVKSDN